MAIYTVGYGSRSVEELIALLKHYGIEYLIDVRSQPYSKFKPEYTKSNLQRSVEQAGLRYVFMGDTLGGRPGDPELYLKDGRADYPRVAETPAYKDGIQRLRTALGKALVVVLMCSEGKPQECHRSKLIGATLSGEGIEVLHIDENGELKTQAETLQEITHGQLSMFEDSPQTSTSRKAYKK